MPPIKPLRLGSVAYARIMQPSWWSAFNDKDALANLSDERIHDMGDYVTYMLPNAEEPTCSRPSWKSNR